MSTRVFTDPRPSIKLSDGVTPNALGKVYFFEPGEGNTTPKSVFTNSSLTIAATNPVILNGSGQTSGDIYLDGDYRVVIKTSAGGTLYDSPSYQRSVAAEQYGEWTSFTTYAIKDIVRGTDGNYYQSLSSNNNGSDPVITTGKWVQIFFISEYSLLRSYQSGEIAVYDNRYYKSLSDGNLGYTPLTNRSKWSLTETQAYISGQSYVVSDNVYEDGVLYRCILDSTGNLPSTSPTYWLSVAADPDVLSPAVSGFVRTGFTTYIQEDGGFSQIIRLSTELTNQNPFSAWESIGPTGSGADVIWSALDNIPANAKSIIIRINALTERDSVADDDFLSQVYFKPEASTILSPQAANRIIWTQGYGGTTVKGVASAVSQVIIPVTSTIIADFSYTSIDSTSDVIDATLIGYQA